MCLGCCAQLGGDQLGVIVGVGRTEVTVLNRLSAVRQVKPSALRGKRNFMRCVIEARSGNAATFLSSSTLLVRVHSL